MHKEVSTGTDIAIRFGKRVRQIRVERTNYSQERLADRAGVHRTFIGRVERGETNITLENICRIVNALNTSHTEFFSSFEENASE
jgi:transcriptional regulator with XRE-family HTH domain